MFTFSSKHKSSIYRRVAVMSILLLYYNLNLNIIRYWFESSTKARRSSLCCFKSRYLSPPVFVYCLQVLTHANCPYLCTGWVPESVWGNFLVGSVSSQNLSVPVVCSLYQYFLSYKIIKSHLLLSKKNMPNLSSCFI